MWALKSSSQSAVSGTRFNSMRVWMQACAQGLYGRKTEQRKNLVLDVQHFALQLSSLAQHFLLVFVLLLQLHLHLFQLQEVCRRSANAIGNTLSQTNHITNLPVWPCCKTALAFSPRIRNSEKSFNEYNILKNKNNRIKPFEDCLWATWTKLWSQRNLWAHSEPEIEECPPFYRRTALSHQPLHPYSQSLLSGPAAASPSPSRAAV